MRKLKSPICAWQSCHKALHHHWPSFRLGSAAWCGSAAKTWQLLWHADGRLLMVAELLWTFDPKMGGFSHSSEGSTYSKHSRRLRQTEFRLSLPSVLCNQTVPSSAHSNSGWEPFSAFTIFTNHLDGSSLILCLHS